MCDKVLELELLHYRELLSKQVRITNEITFLLENSEKDSDNAISRKLESLRNEQKEVEREIEQHRGKLRKI